MVLHVLQGGMLASGVLAPSPHRLLHPECQVLCCLSTGPTLGSGQRAGPGEGLWVGGPGLNSSVGVLAAGLQGLACPLGAGRQGYSRR